MALPLVCFNMYAPMAKLVDAPDLGSGIERCESSSLSWGTKVLYSVILDNTTQGYLCVDAGVLFQLQSNNGDEASMVMQWTVNPPPTARLVRSQ